VAVFVELHHKNLLLKEQSALLAERLADGAGSRDGSSEGSALVAELSARLAAAEEQAEEVEKLVQAEGGEQIACADVQVPVQLLNARLARLRSAIDALGPPQA
jgi:hypothetical protein